MFDKPVLGVLHSSPTQNKPATNDVNRTLAKSMGRYSKTESYCKRPTMEKRRTLLLERRFNEFKYHLNRDIETKLREKFTLDQNRNIVSGLTLSVMSASELPGFDEQLHQGVDKSLLLISNCRICHVSMNAPTQAQQHYTGKNHSKKIRQYLDRLKLSMEAKETTKECSLLNCSANGRNLSMKSSTTGLKIEESTANKPSINKNNTITVTSETSHCRDSTDYCRVCDVSFNSDKQATQHYTGRNHARRKTISEMNQVAVKIEPACDGRKALFLCTVCHIQTTSNEQLKSHLRGAKHTHKLSLTARFGSERRQYRNTATNRSRVHPPRHPQTYRDPFTVKSPQYHTGNSPPYHSGSSPPHLQTNSPPPYLQANSPQYHPSTNTSPQYHPGTNTSPQYHPGTNTSPPYLPINRQRTEMNEIPITKFGYQISHHMDRNIIQRNQSPPSVRAP